MVSKLHKQSELEVINRAIDPQMGDWSEDLAQAVMAISVAPADRDRMHVLAKMAQAGTLSADEEAEIEMYQRATGILEILKAKAHVSILRAGKRH